MNRSSCHQAVASVALVLSLSVLSPASVCHAQAALALPEGCTPLTDKAGAADLKAATAQSQRQDMPEQIRLYEEAVQLWTHAVEQCQGRSQSRAQRNLQDNQKILAALREQMGAGPMCAASHKDAAALQDLARSALGDRRWGEASVLFRKAENMWDLAAERCTGAQHETANRRREQAHAWMWERIHAGLKQAFEEHPQVAAQMGSVTQQVLDGQLPASTAARQLLAVFQKPAGGESA